MHIICPKKEQCNYTILHGIQVNNSSRDISYLLCVRHWSKCTAYIIYPSQQPDGLRTMTSSLTEEVQKVTVGARIQTQAIRL